MSKKIFSFFLLCLSAALILAAPVANAQLACHEVYSADPSAQSKWSIAAVENLIRENKKEIPAFYKIVGDRKIPVMLLTKNSIKPLEDLIEDTMSHTVMLMYDPETPLHTDHGIFRIGKYMADLDSPGIRGYGEANNNGLSWKQVRPYLDRRVRDEENGVTSNFERFEIVFKITPQQKQDVLFYQLVRRATVFRVPWTFKGPDVIQEGKPNLLNGCGEHCYIFSTGSGARSQISQIRFEIQRMGIPDVDVAMSNPAVQEFVQMAREKILATPYNSETMKWDIVNGKRAMETLAGVLPENLDLEQKRVLANWFVALSATKGYENVQRSLGLNGGWGLAEIQNPNVVGILVWAPEKKARVFKNATYSSVGIQTTWTKDNQVPFQ